MPIPVLNTTGEPVLTRPVPEGEEILYTIQFTPDERPTWDPYVGMSMHCIMTQHILLSEGRDDARIFFGSKERIKLVFWVYSSYFFLSGESVHCLQKANGYQSEICNIPIACQHGALTRTGVAYNVCYWYMHHLKVSIRFSVSLYN
jgi:hypothetical protein